MTWIFSQSTGLLTHNGRVVSREGYSGHGSGKNNPSMASVEGVGPTPAGHWSVGPPHDSPRTGTFTMDLDPLPGTNTFGRTLFRVHGDSRLHPGSASDGCIVLPLAVREEIWSSSDHEIEVVP